VSVKVVDGSNIPVFGATVAFSASINGVELFPTQATTTKLGIARTLVHLPTIVNSSFTITGTAVSGGSFSQTVSIGMRLVRTFGSPNTSGGAVRPDGTFLAGATKIDAAGAFNPDGSLRNIVASPYAAGKIPAIGMYPAVAPDGTPYYWDSQQGFLVLLDSNLTPTAAFDLLSQSITGTIPVIGSLPPPVVDANHKIYTVPPTCNAFYALDASGSVIGQHGLAFEPFQGSCYLTLSPSGNPVVYGMVSGLNQSANYFLAVEYDPNGNVLHHGQLNTLPRLFARTDGTYVTDTIGGNVSVLDTDFHVMRNLFAFNHAWGALAGVDNNGRYYFQTILPAWDPSTDVIGFYTIVDGAGNVLFSNGQPDGSAAPYPMYNQNHGTQVFAADSATDTVYAINYTADSKHILVVYKNGVYVSSYPTTMSNKAQLSPSGEFYDLVDYYGAMKVYDLTGKLVRSLTYPQITGYGIAIIRVDSRGYKYVDVFGKTVHVIAPDDSYIKAITVSQALSGYQGFDLAQDGNFIFSSSGTVLKIDQSGVVLWSVSVSPYIPPVTGTIAVDAAGRIYFGSLVMDSNGKTISDVGFFKQEIVPIGKHVLMFGHNTIYELSAE
jgi:hypothetical protein